MAKHKAIENCIFCGGMHNGSCEDAQPKPKAAPKPRALKVATPPPAPVEAKLAPSKLDRMMQAAGEWKPKVESTPRTRPQPAPEPQVERSYNTALDPDTVALNAAIRTLAAAELLGPKAEAEWSSVIHSVPTLEEEKLLWRLRQTSA